MQTKYLPAREHAVTLAAVQVSCKRGTQQARGMRVRLDTVALLRNPREGEGWQVLWGEPAVGGDSPVSIDEHYPPISQAQLCYSFVRPVNRPCEHLHEAMGC